MMLPTLIAIACSAILIILLCANDPKRRRSAGLADALQTSAIRRSFAALACLPGVVLALMGDAAAFLMWLGACASLGWFVTLWFGDRRQRG